MGPHVTKISTIMTYGRKLMVEPTIGRVMTTLQDAAGKVPANEMSDVEATLVSQAMALNGMFGHLS
jgi:hypothetical protein